MDAPWVDFFESENCLSQVMADFLAMRENSFPGLVIKLLAVMSRETVHVVPEMHSSSILNMLI